MDTTDIIIYSAAALGVLLLLLIAIQIVRYVRNYVKGIQALEDFNRILTVFSMAAEAYMLSKKDNIEKLEDKDTVENETDYGKLFPFNSPGDIIEGDSIHVHQVLPDGNLLCVVEKHDAAGNNEESVNVYLPVNETGRFRYYDGQDIPLPSTAVIFQTGVFQYDGGIFATPSTLPAVSIFGMKEFEPDNIKNVPGNDVN